MDYWRECIESSFEEAGITASEEQVEAVAGDVQVAHENYGMAHGYDAIPNPRDADIDRLKARIRDLERERDQVEMNFRQNVARRHRCDLTQVELGENGDATVHPR